MSVSTSIENELKAEISDLRREIQELKQGVTMPAYLQEMQNELEQVKKEVAKDKVSMVVFSGDLDRVLGSFCNCQWCCCDGNRSGHVFYILGHSCVT